MKRVLLMRHAKSSWKDTAVPDHDRPLAGRGKRAAKAMGRYMRDERVAPALVLCSTARRARETLARIEPGMARHSVRVERQLYGASADALLERLRRVPDTFDSVLMIGHNPGLQELALCLAAPSAERDELGAKYPTAALATLEVSAESWRAVDPGSARLVGFVRPRDLES